MVTLTRAQRAAIWCVAAGALLIALIGFTGSYTAVQGLAERKGFGLFSYVFPVGVDVGIAVLLALDLVLTWLRIPFPLLRQTAWLLTAGTIVFNAASAWPDPLAVGMHAIIPVLFVVVVEAARHAVSAIADIAADKHMESVRLVRWLLSPVPTFRLWRRMKLWELRSYDEVVQLEQNRLIYRTRLRAQYGRAWRRQAPVELLLPLKLTRYGVPLPELPSAVAQTATTAEVVALTANVADAGPGAVGDLPDSAKITTTDLAPHAAGRAAFAAAEAEQMAAMASGHPVAVITTPLLSSESTDLASGLPEVPAEAFLTWLDGQQQPPAEQPVPDPQAATESPDPEPDRDRERVLKLAAGQAARLERLRQKRQDAADAWWAQLRQGVTPVHAAHAKAFGISPPTLHKALTEFPEPTPEAAP